MIPMFAILLSDRRLRRLQIVRLRNVRLQIARRRMGRLQIARMARRRIALRRSGFRRRHRQCGSCSTCFVRHAG